MKRLLILITVFITFQTVCHASDISVIINNEPITFDALPIISNDRVLVPMRSIFEQLGCEVEWLGESKTVIATKNSLLIAMRIDNNKIILTNIETGKTEVKETDTPPIINNDRTLIPVRIISETLGYNVNWNEEKQQVIITDYRYKPQNL